MVTRCDYQPVSRDWQAGKGVEGGGAYVTTMDPVAAGAGGWWCHGGGAGSAAVTPSVPKGSPLLTAHKRPLSGSIGYMHSE